MLTQEKIQPTTTRLIRINEASKLTGVPRSSIYALLKIAECNFPQPVSLGGRRSIAFVESEIHAWIDSQVAARDKVLNGAVA
jgi:prophage regulatory protein